MMIACPFSPYHLFLPLNEALLFYKDSVDGRLRLCLPKTTHKEIFTLAHDRENHFSLVKTYNRLVMNYFVPHLLRALKIYISHYPQCALNRTLRDKSHGLVKPIESKPIPFHTLTIDFILALPPSRRFGHGDELYDTVMTGTDKFTKVVRLIPGKSTYAAPDWAAMY